MPELLPDDPSCVHRTLVRTQKSNTRSPLDGEQSFPYVRSRTVVPERLFTEPQPPSRFEEPVTIAMTRPAARPRATPARHATPRAELAARRRHAQYRRRRAVAGVLV